MSKLIVIEGTDCSGKETQTNLLLERLKKEKIKIEKLSFPMYDTPTGKIVGGPYLGKEHISKGLFEEGAAKVDPKVSALYFAADRKYNSPKIINLLKKGYNVILDRYVVSNMAHQAGKLKVSEHRYEMYNWLDSLEYGLLELPRANLTILLYVPYKNAYELKKNRKEKPDQHEISKEHLKLAEAAYLELADLYNFKIVNCVKNNKIRTIEDIHEEVYKIVSESLKEN
ncbi:MAG: thymidylate kinase [Tenericutes bacterium]|nr:thymidylate kinase [Bacilli bacterium]MDD3995834.1 thymidylate kinase [Bacilli bacterium]MDD4624488.1 thymidylate kinase [Bacilli bacterium]NLV90498.1 thymidylate kinase [Mycoplasmatota bacterium]